MSTTFTGFSEEDLKRIKSGDSSSKSEITPSNIKRIDKFGGKQKRVINQYKLPALLKQDSDDNINIFFDKCKLSIKTPTSPSDDSSNNNDSNQNQNDNESDSTDDRTESNNNETNLELMASPTSTVEDNHDSVSRSSSINSEIRKMSSDSPPDIVRCADNYTEDEMAAHKAKLAELQLQQRIMEEQNKKRKEMLSKALADRTKQTEEEVLRLEKIKKELQILDGQFSQDVSVLRKKIDQACLTYADAEKHYLKVEKEFLHAKIQLQKEKEKKELLTEHLCALITHNETRKAQKLETLMLELATDRKDSDLNRKSRAKDIMSDEDEKPVIVDGVDEKTGKMVEFNDS